MRSPTMVSILTIILAFVTIILAFVKVDFLKPAHPFMLEAGPVVGNFEAEERGHNGK